MKRRMEAQKTNITPEILAGDIQRYLREGISLEEIHKGALENGISEDTWKTALEIQQKTKRKKKKRGFFSLFIVLLVLIGGGLLLTDSTNDSQLKGDFAIPENKPEKKEEKEVFVYADTRFQEKINAKEITVLKKYDQKKNIQTISDIKKFIVSEVPDFLNIKKIFFEFDKSGNVDRTMIVFWDRKSQEKIFLQNTERPYKIKQGVLYESTEKKTPPSQMLINTLWEVLFEKIQFETFEKKNLTFDIEIYSREGKKYVRTSLLYPEEGKDSSIEVDFYEYQNVLKEDKIAFGKDIRISTGFFTEKYPIRKRPVPRSSTEETSETP